MSMKEPDFKNKEHWLRKQHEVVNYRRSSMYRLIIEMSRGLLLGNAGGLATLIGIMSSSQRVSETGFFHWIAIITSVMFLIGLCFSFATLILVTSVSVREAHSAETAMKKFSDGDFTREQMLFYVEDRTRSIASSATVCGILSIVMMGIGIGLGLVQLAYYF